MLTAALLLAAAHAEPVVVDQPPRPEPLDIRLERYTLIPPQVPHEHLKKQLKRPHDVAYDPAVIPYSGWHFFGHDGERQPWRKRTLNYAGTPNGQSFDNSDRQHNKHILFVDWSIPQLEKLKSLDIAAKGNNTNPLPPATGYFGTREKSKDYFYAQEYLISDIPSLPDQVPLSATNLSGEWEVVAKVSLNTKLPVGNDQIQVNYLGPIRAHDPDNEAIGTQKIGLLFVEHDTELYASQEFDADQWHFEYKWFNKQDEQYDATDYVEPADTRYLFSNDADEFDHIKVCRLPYRTQQLKAFDLTPIKSLPPDQLRPRKIDLTDKHRFGESVVIELETRSAGAQCLLDIDTGKVFTMPDPMPTGKAFAEFAEEHGIDLYARYETESRKGVVRIQTLACPMFYLEQPFWDRSPKACITEIQSKQHYRPAVLSRINPQEWTPILATTCDGTMVLFRETKVEADTENKTAKVTLEIRRLSEP